MQLDNHCKFSAVKSGKLMENIANGNIDFLFLQSDANVMVDNHTVTKPPAYLSPVICAYSLIGDVAEKVWNYMLLI